MRVSLSWLREFVPAELARRSSPSCSTPAGSRSRDRAPRGRVWTGWSSRAVLEVRDHPNSDKLCVATRRRRATDGRGRRRRPEHGRRRPGPVGPARARASRARPSRSRRVSLRGVVSNGMLCSPRELAISHEHGASCCCRRRLAPRCRPEAGARSRRRRARHRGRTRTGPTSSPCYGVAREVAARPGVPLGRARTPTVDGGGRAAQTRWRPSRSARPDGCPRYVARVIRGVGRIATPLRAQARLTACGMRPISSVVDATNYAMLELGQPLHAFDLRRLAGPGIVVRRARGRRAAHARSTASSGSSRTEDLLICDVERPVAIAGVMGGADLRGFGAPRPTCCWRARILHADAGSCAPLGGWTSIRRPRTGSSGVPTRRASERGGPRCAG